MGGVIKAVTKAIKDPVGAFKSVLKSPLMQFAAPFIPVVGPFLAIGQKISGVIDTLKSGNLKEIAGGLLGKLGGNFGNALNQTMNSVLGKAEGWLGKAGTNFATSVISAMGGNTNDIAKLAGMAQQAVKNNPIVDETKAREAATLIQHNATRIAQYAQALGLG